MAPILEDRCVSCHREGRAPYDLTDPWVLDGLAPLIEAHVEARTMPPWLPGPGSPSLSGDLSLTDDDRDVLLRWFSSGSSAGGPLQAPPEVAWSPTFELALPSWEARGDQTRRCFVVDLPHDPLVAYDVVGTPAVHHVLVATHPEGARAELEALDATEPGPGWPCVEAFMPSSALSPGAVPVLWFPGAEPTRTRLGTGALLEPVGVVQVHGLPGGPAEALLQLETDADAFPEISIALGIGDIDPQETHQVVRKAFVRDWLPDGTPTGDTLWVTGVRGHGHEQLTSLRISTDDVVLLDLPRYDPDWQARYVLVDPILVSLDATLTLRCTYDASRPTDYDEPEMCGGWVFAVP